jgi:hypothetical protein
MIVIRLLIVSLLLCVQCGCVNQLGVPYGVDGEVHLSEDQIQEAKCNLSVIEGISEAKGKTSGSFVFEGIVTHVEIIGDGNINAHFDVNRMIFGINSREVIVITNMNSMYGVDFKIGEKYRVGGYVIAGQYMTWSWFGTYSIHGLDKALCK